MRCLLAWDRLQAGVRRQERGKIAFAALGLIESTMTLFATYRAAAVRYGSVLLAAALVSRAGVPSDASTIVFLSDKGFGEGTVVDSPTITVRPNELQQLYVWVKTNDNLGAVGVDLIQDDGLLKFENVTVHNPLAKPNVASVRRWAIAYAEIVADQSIENMHGVTLLSVGSLLGPEYEAFDALFDPNVGAYLFATVDYIGLGVGQTELFFRINSHMFGGLQQVDVVSLGTGDSPAENLAGATSLLADATISVVPEPQSICLALFSLATVLGLVRARLSRKRLD